MTVVVARPVARARARAAERAVARAAAARTCPRPVGSLQRTSEINELALTRLNMM